MKKFISFILTAAIGLSALPQIAMAEEGFTVDKEFYPEFRKKALVLSFDDSSATYDPLVIERLNSAGMKATFNVMLGSSDGEVFLSTEADKEKIKARYAGHEIAIHNEKHLNMLAKNTNGEYVYSNAECIADIENAKDWLTDAADYPVTGFAWPYTVPTGRTEVIGWVENNCLYARGSGTTNKFDVPASFFPAWTFTSHQIDHKTVSRYEEYLEYDDTKLSLYSIWGHGWEYPSTVPWSELEELTELYTASSDVVWNATCADYVRYMNARNELQVSDELVYNPSSETLYITVDGEEVVLPPECSYDGDNVISNDTRTEVTISGITANGKVFDGNPLTWSMEDFAVTNKATGEAVALTTDDFSYTWYKGEAAYEGVPFDAGVYRLVVSVKPDNQSYYGKTEIKNIVISKKQIVIKPKDIEMSVGGLVPCPAMDYSMLGEADRTSEYVSTMENKYISFSLTNADGEAVDFNTAVANAGTYKIISDDIASIESDISVWSKKYNYDITYQSYGSLVVKDEQIADGYELTFKADADNVKKITVSSDGDYLLPTFAAFTKEGYYLRGWKNGTKYYKNGERITVSGDMEFDAVWVSTTSAMANVSSLVPYINEDFSTCGANIFNTTFDRVNSYTGVTGERVQFYQQGGYLKTKEKFNDFVLEFDFEFGRVDRINMTFPGVGTVYYSKSSSGVMGDNIRILEWNGSSYIDTGFYTEATKTFKFYSGKPYRFHIEKLNDKFSVYVRDYDEDCWLYYGTAKANPEKESVINIDSSYTPNPHGTPKLQSFIDNYVLYDLSLSAQSTAAEQKFVEGEEGSFNVTFNNIPDSFTSDDFTVVNAAGEVVTGLTVQGEGKEYTVTIPDTFRAGTYTMDLSGVKLTMSESSYIVCDTDITFTVNMKEPEKATFNVGNAEGTVEPIIVDSIGQVITLPDDTGLTYDGYWLKGWKVNGGDTTLYRPGEAFTVTSLPIEFNAVWSKIYNIADTTGWNVAVNETFDDGATTHKNWITPSKTEYNSYFVKNNMLNLGYNQNVLKTNIAFDDVIMEFDYRPYFIKASENRMVFDICGTSFHMVNMESVGGIASPLGVTSGQSVTRENTYTFKHEIWYQFRIERVGTEFKLYVKEFEDEYYTLIYKGTTPEGANPIKINVYDTSNWTGASDNTAGGNNGYMDNLKIYQPKPVLIPNVVDGKVTVNVSGFSEWVPFEVIAAAYKDEVMTSISAPVSVTANGTYEPELDVQDADSIKVFGWDNINGMVPMAVSAQCPTEN